MGQCTTPGGFRRNVSLVSNRPALPRADYPAQRRFQMQNRRPPMLITAMLATGGAFNRVPAREPLLRSLEAGSTVDGDFGDGILFDPSTALYRDEKK